MCLLKNVVIINLWLSFIGFDFGMINVFFFLDLWNKRMCIYLKYIFVFVDIVGGVIEVGVFCVFISFEFFVKFYVIGIENVVIDLGFYVIFFLVCKMIEL